MCLYSGKLIAISFYNYINFAVFDVALFNRLNSINHSLYYSNQHIITTQWQLIDAPKKVSIHD